MLKILHWLAGGLTLVAFWFAGGWLNHALSLPFPGPLTGLLLLFLSLLLMRRVPEGLQEVSHFLLQHISLFFVPVTLYVFVLKERFAEHLWLLLAAIVVSTFVSMLLAVWVSKRFVKQEQVN